MLAKVTIFVSIIVASAYGSSDCPPPFQFAEAELGGRIQIDIDNADAWTFSSDNFRTVQEVERCDSDCDREEKEVYFLGNGTLVIPKLKKEHLGFYTAFADLHTTEVLESEDYADGVPKYVKGYAFVIETKY